VIPVERITFRRTTDPMAAFRAFAERLAAYRPSDGANFSSVHYSCRPNGPCVGRSLFKIPYLPVLSGHPVGDDVVVTARPSFVELAVVVVVVAMLRYTGFSTLTVLGLAALYHIAGYACFKLTMGDLRPILSEFVDEGAAQHIGWT
jgi:hypothetical protein